MKKITSFFKSLLMLSVALGAFNAFAETPTQPPSSAQATQQVEPVIISDKLNINTATAEEIKHALIGIGSKKAEAIVQYREKFGKFTAAEQLLEVKGIGKATLEKNRDRIIF
ncbi:ComEA family DNA-binding protein [Histophilus somni]|uniref:Helix-hairpin-helix domain-containing protein n=1 Tax=Histophilus somni TaxID=731 RepID=A0A9Q7E5D2_HISSO|nr:helix-hairpin-helix domain-containing protein [Histophilus somni]ACA31813.1 competence protein ComEA helix-hairpin-helix repeat protein [Histophilus somni 2336]ARU64136.1 competence protein ComE [Histophilus somni]ARU65917.1 competence protein ComE [Histophilus somni]ARU67791.1 competence protein ComE [Histophilus somni]ARU69671.1 competence protein ComE [Histophilus somni]